MLAELDDIPTAPGRARPVPRGRRPQTHVFLLGFPRSGTTLLEQVLASHPDVVALEERETLADAQRAFQMQPSDMGRLGPRLRGRARAAARCLLGAGAGRGRRAGGKVFVDKHPLHTFRLPLILKLFPTPRSCSPAATRATWCCRAIAAASP
jgi:hypothetical protein